MHTSTVNMTTISNIRNDIFSGGTTQRIVIKVNTKTLNPEDYRASAYNIVSVIFPDWTNDPRPTFPGNRCMERAHFHRN